MKEWRLVFEWRQLECAARASGLSERFGIDTPRRGGRNGPALLSPALRARGSGAGKGVWQLVFEWRRGVRGKGVVDIYFG